MYQSALHNLFKTLFPVSRTSGVHPLLKLDTYLGHSIIKEYSLYGPDNLFLFGASEVALVFWAAFMNEKKNVFVGHLFVVTVH